MLGVPSYFFQECGCVVLSTPAFAPIFFGVFANFAWLDVIFTESEVLGSEPSGPGAVILLRAE